MAINYNPNIVLDKLVLCLDAANPKSYSGSGSIWKDLSGNKNNASIIGTSTWDNTYGGQFDFGDVAQVTQYISLPHQAAQSVGNFYTLEFWMKPISSDDKFFCSMAASDIDNNYFLLAQQSLNLKRFGATGSISYSNNEILQFCVVKNQLNENGLLYKNGGEPVSSDRITSINGVADNGWILNQEQDSVGNAFDSGQNYRGSFMVVRLYNKALSQSEIKQNFNALRGRYSL